SNRCCVRAEGKAATPSSWTSRRTSQSAGWTRTPRRFGASRRVVVTRQRGLVARFYLTTAIDYANGDPHHGHAYEKIGADVIARYKRMRGDDVYFLTGLDEHGQKVAQAAAERSLPPQQFVDEIASRFERMWQRLSISYDRFMRTTAPDHKRGVKALIERI